MKKFDIFLMVVFIITLMWTMFQIRPFEIVLGCFIVAGIGTYFLMKLVFKVDFQKKNHYSKRSKR